MSASSSLCIVIDLDEDRYVPKHHGLLRAMSGYLLLYSPALLNVRCVSSVHIVANIPERFSLNK